MISYPIPLSPVVFQIKRTAGQNLSRYTLPKYQPFLTATFSYLGQHEITVVFATRTHTPTHRFGLKNDLKQRFEAERNVSNDDLAVTKCVLGNNFAGRLPDESLKDCTEKMKQRAKLDEEQGKRRDLSIDFETKAEEAIN